MPRALPWVSFAPGGTTAQLNKNTKNKLEVEKT
jgi:hypothetical protein